MTKKITRKKRVKKKNILRSSSREKNVQNSSLSKEEKEQLEKFLDAQIRQTILNVFKGPMLQFIEKVAPSKKQKFIELVEKEIENKSDSSFSPTKPAKENNNAKNSS